MAWDRSAIASDVPRSRRQLWARRLASLVINVFKLNEAGPWSTEFCQMLNPTATIPTKYGNFVCRAGHGRLRWRAETFHTEEPETIAWLDALTPADRLWDVGANVGLYSIYAAKFRGCQVMAFEPESQNYALLVENIALNGVAANCLAAPFALSNVTGLGRLEVRYITKGGAYNVFQRPDERFVPENPELFKASLPVTQLTFGVSIDELATKYELAAPTHLKVDVDSIESLIVEGASNLLRGDQVRSILIEVNQASERDRLIPEILKQHGFILTSERSNWLSREDRSNEWQMPAVNMIFHKG